MSKNKNTFTLPSFEIITVVIGIIASLVGIISFATGFNSIGELTNGNPTQETLQNLELEISVLKDEQLKLNQRVNALSQVSDQAALSSEIESLKSSTNDLNNRFSIIENLLVQNPQKALEIPLMRKDLDNLSATTDMQIATLRQDIERSYNLLLVTIVSLTVAVLATAVGNLFKKGEKEKET